MPNIYDLPDAVLAQILFEAAATPAKTLYKWKFKLPLLAVCRKWTKLAIGAVFGQVYIELSIARNDSLLWLSNADLFISRRCVLMAQRLTIEWSYLTNPDHFRYIVLDILKLDCVDWQRICSLIFTKAAQNMPRSVKPISLQNLACSDIARTIQYFVQNLRSVVELNLSYLSGPTGEYLQNHISAHYAQQLQVLRAQYSLAFPVSCFMRNIKVLELTLDRKAFRVLPNICGETLRVLKLEVVPHNFAWHYFRNEVSIRPIVFRHLTILHLSFEGRNTQFTKSDIQEKIALGARNCDQLSFPALRKLAIDYCTPDCDLLYADLPFPKLEKVVLFGTAQSICHCSRLKLFWVRDLLVKVFPSDAGDSGDIYMSTNHLFTDIFIDRTASLCCAADWFVLDPEEMRWVNVTNIEVVYVDYVAVCRAISRLPNLCELSIFRLRFHNTDTDRFSTDAPLFVSADPMLVWGKKLAALTICKFHQGPLAVYVGCVQALISHADVLRKLVVPKPARQPIAMFINSYKDRYHHLAKIQLLGSEWQ